MKHHRTRNTHTLVTKIVLTALLGGAISAFTASCMGTAYRSHARQQGRIENRQERQQGRIENRQERQENRWGY